MEHDFYLKTGKNRTEKDGNLIPLEKIIKFEAGNSYNKSITR